MVSFYKKKNTSYILYIKTLKQKKVCRIFKQPPSHQTVEFRASSSAMKKTFGHSKSKVEVHQHTRQRRLAEWADTVCRYVQISRSTSALLQVLLQEKETVSIFNCPATVAVARRR